MKKKFTNDRVEQIMSSLDGIQHSGAPDFFYTRLLAKMQPEEKKKTVFIFRPVFITTVLTFLLFLNVFLLIRVKNTYNEKATVKTNTPATLESFAKAYDMNTESDYE